MSRVNVEKPRVGTGVFAVTPSDTVDFLTPAVGFYVGTAGNVSVVAEDGTVATIAVTAGQFVAVLTRRINATGTTSTGIVGLV